jgi:ATP dependent DNA ligase domain
VPVFGGHSSAFASQSARSRTPSIDTPAGRGFPGAARNPTYRAMLWRTSPARSRRAPPVGFIRPCQPFLVVRPPAGPGWLHEVKHDGYRIVARKQGESVSLWSRYGADFTDRLPRIAEAIGKLPADGAHGDAKLTDLLQTLANCPKARSARIHDRCKAVFGQRLP